MPDHALGGQREMGPDELLDLVLGDLGRAERIDHERDGLGDADGVGQLDFDLVGQAGGDEVLGDVAGHVGAGAVDLGGVLPRKAAAAVAADPP